MQALGAEHPALAWLKGRFVQVEEEWFGDLMVALYRREGG